MPSKYLKIAILSLTCNFRYLEGCTRAHKVLNLISLEVSDTPLSSSILPPRFVRQVDWSHRYWPDTRRARGDAPKVLKYVLMSVAGAYTDFHVDFGGTSVWYHVLRGAKRFYLIPPTLSNLQKYQQWITSSHQDSTFFGDNMDISYVDITAGDTLLIPSGYIHAVYTPEKSLVVGGNFLVSSSIIKQLQVASIEIHSHIQKKYRYPHYSQMLWYTLCGILAEWKEEKKISDTVLWQFPYLIVACEDWVKRITEDGSEWAHANEASKEIKYHSPHAVIESCWQAVENLESTELQRHVMYIRTNRCDVMTAEAYTALRDIITASDEKSETALRIYKSVFGVSNGVQAVDIVKSEIVQPTCQKPFVKSDENSTEKDIYSDPKASESKNCESEDQAENPIVLRISRKPTAAEPVVLKVALPPKNTVRKSSASGGSMFGTRGKKLTKSFLSNALDVDIDVYDKVSTGSDDGGTNSNDRDDFSVSEDEPLVDAEEDDDEDEIPVAKKPRTQPMNRGRGGTSNRGRGSSVSNRQKLAKQLGMWR